MELTQEHFDKVLSGLMEEITTIKTDMATKLATKEDLKAQTIELKHYVHEAFETQQVWMDERFSELIVKYDVRERVGKLEKDVAQLKLNTQAHV